MTAATIQKITTLQIRKIFAIGRTLGIVEGGIQNDALHDLVFSITGKGSLKALTYAEAQAVIRDLEKRQGDAPPPRRRPTVHTERSGGATAGQQRKVWALMYELQKHDTVPSMASLGERLCGIIKKELRLDANPEQPFAWVTFPACNKLIEVLKKYVANAKKKAGEGK